MKKTLLALAACAALLGGCGNDKDQQIASLKGQVNTLQTELKQSKDHGKDLQADLDKNKARTDSLQGQLADYDTKLIDAKAKINDLNKELDKAKGNAGQVAELQKKITALQGEIDTLKATKAQPPKPETDPAKATENPKEGPRPDPEVVKQLDDLLPLIKAATDTTSLGKARKLVQGADKATRDSYIEKIRQWVKDEPDNKHARLALAAMLSTRFQDLKDPMKMGALAGEMEQETKKALEIDPDYYEAQHFLAILEVNYPVFTPEFKGAGKDLDKALELQKNMTWQDKFADIYTAYAKWYRMQNKYDEADAKVQAGLDHAPRNEGLLAEQKAIEDARNAAQEG